MRSGSRTPTAMHMSMHIMHIIHICAIVSIVQHLTTYQSHLCVILMAMTKSCDSPSISVCMCVHMHTYVYELVSPTTHESTFIMHHPVHMYTYHICVFFLSLFFCLRLNVPWRNGHLVPDAPCRWRWNCFRCWTHNVLCIRCWSRRHINFNRTTRR